MKGRFLCRRGSGSGVRAQLLSHFPGGRPGAGRRLSVPVFVIRWAPSGGWRCQRCSAVSPAAAWPGWSIVTGPPGSETVPRRGHSGGWTELGLRKLYPRWSPERWAGRGSSTSRWAPCRSRSQSEPTERSPSARLGPLSEKGLGNPKPSADSGSSGARVRARCTFSHLPPMRLFPPLPRNIRERAATRPRAPTLSGDTVRLPEVSVRGCLRLDLHAGCYSTMSPTPSHLSHLCPWAW